DLLHACSRIGIVSSNDDKLARSHLATSSPTDGKRDGGGLLRPTIASNIVTINFICLEPLSSLLRASEQQNTSVIIRSQQTIAESSWLRCQHVPLSTVDIVAIPALASHRLRIAPFCKALRNVEVALLIREHSATKTRRYLRWRRNRLQRATGWLIHKKGRGHCIAIGRIANGKKDASLSIYGCGIVKCAG